MPAKSCCALAVFALMLAPLPTVRAGNPQVEADPYVCDAAPFPYGGSSKLYDESKNVCEPQSWVAASAELLWLSRTKAESQDMVFATISGSQIPMVNVDEMMFAVKSGVRTRAMYGNSDGERFEVVYAGIYDQVGSASTKLDPAIPGLTSVTYDFFGTTQGTANAYTATTDSTLHSVELNYGLRQCWRIRPLIGIRWLRHDEIFRIIETANSTYGANAEMKNDMLGGQAGFDVGLWDRGGWFRVEAGLKGGIYRDFMNLYADVHDISGPTQSLEHSFETTAFSGEVNVTAIWQFSRHASVRCGYTGLWLADIGLAPNQSSSFDLTSGGGRLNRDLLSYQGGHIGLELIY